MDRSHVRSPRPIVPYYVSARFERQMDPLRREYLATDLTRCPGTRVSRYKGVSLIREIDVSPGELNGSNDRRIRLAPYFGSPRMEAVEEFLYSGAGVAFGRSRSAQKPTWA